MTLQTKLSTASFAMIALFTLSASFATPATFLRQVPISAQAIAADPALANMQTWDLKVTVPAGENWGYTGFLARLDTGSFYNAPLGANWPEPQFWPLFPNLRYDTFATRAADPDIDATFGQPEWYSGYPEYPAPIEFTPDKVSVVYLTERGTLTGAGEFTIARLTFTNDARGSIIGFTAGRTPDTGPVNWGFPLPVPEPALGVAALALIALTGRRR